MGTVDAFFHAQLPSMFVAVACSCNKDDSDKDKLSKKLVTNLKANVQNMIGVVKDGCGRVVRYPVSGRYKLISNKNIRASRSL